MSAASRVLGGATALDRYVAAPDPSFRYHPVASLRGDGYRVHVLELISQRWRDETEVDRPQWQHWLTIVVPDQPASDAALLLIGGGSNGAAPPMSVNPLLASAALTTRTVTAELHIVPNQPLTFAGQSKRRAEDGIIAYSWDKYLRTGEEIWPLRLPMTKSVVRAMDANTDHSLKGSDARESALAFYEAIVCERPCPKFSCRFEPDGSITVMTETRPISALLRQATNPNARDFRLETIGPAYRRSPLDESQGIYTARVLEPARGWIAYFVELISSADRFPFKFTTAVRVAPDTPTFGPPPETP